MSPRSDARAAATEGPVPRNAGERASAFIAPALVLLGLAIYVGFEVIRPIQGLGNNDVAGIAYEADLILAGGLPYRDTVELKSPGPFFLVAWAWLVLGRSAWALHLACHAWVMLGAVGIGVGTYWLEAGEGSRTSPVLRRTLVGASVALYLAVSAPFESNYTTWMMPPYAWAFALAIVGLRTGRHRWHVAAGAAAALAFFGKTHALVLGVAIPFAWAWARALGGARQRELASTWAWGAWLLGAALGAAPLVAWYAAHGQVRTLVGGVLPFGKAAEYSARDLDATPLRILGGVLDHQWEMMPMLLVASGGTLLLCALQWMTGSHLSSSPETSGDSSLGDSGVAGPSSSREVRLEWPLVVFWALSLVGGGLGGLRYFSHYAPQYVAPMVWLACSAGPWRLSLRVARGVGPQARVLHRVRVVATLVVVATVGTVAAQRVYKGARGRISAGFRPGDSAQEAGAYIAERSEDGERIQVFGWRGWPVYFWSHRLAPGRLYKELGAITEFNRNGRFQPPKEQRNPNLRFKPGPLADELLYVFETTPPAFVVKAIPFFPGVANDPIREFFELDRILRRQYVFGRRFGSLYVFERRDHRATRVASLDEDARRGEQLDEVALEGSRSGDEGMPPDGDMVEVP